TRRSSDLVTDEIVISRRNHLCFCSEATQCGRVQNASAVAFKVRAVRGFLGFWYPAGHIPGSIAGGLGCFDGVWWPILRTEQAGLLRICKGFCILAVESLTVVANRFARLDVQLCFVNLCAMFVGDLLRFQSS